MRLGCFVQPVTTIETANTAAKIKGGKFLTFDTRASSRHPFPGAVLITQKMLIPRKLQFTNVDVWREVPLGDLA